MTTGLAQAVGDQRLRRARGMWGWFRSGQRRLVYASMAVLVQSLLATPVRAQGVETVDITSYVSVDGDSVEVLARVPLSLLDRAGFPVVNGRIDRPASQPAMKAALAAIHDAMGLMADATLLHPSLETGRVTLPSDRSFDSYETAARHVSASTPGDTEVYAGQGYFDAHLQYPVHSPDSRLVLNAAFAPGPSRWPVLSVRYRPLDGEPRSFVVSGGSGQITLNPTRLQTTLDFLERGVRRIYSVPVHVLFLLGLIVPVRRTREGLTALGVFIAGHSLALIGTTSALAPSGTWFAPLAATLAAASVFAIALEHILFTPAAGRWLLVGAYGLAHGLLFSSGLMPDLQFGGPHTVAALLSFNAGIALGEAGVLIVVAAALPWLTRLAGNTRRLIILVSVLLGHFAWHRLVEDGTKLWQSEWPPMETTIPLFGRWVAAILISIGIAKAAGRWVERSWPRRAGGSVSS